MDAKERGVMKFVDDLTVQVVDAESGAPYANQKTKITLADGSTKEKTTDGSGTVELKKVPPGPAKVELPDLGAADPDTDPGKAPAEAQSVPVPPNQDPTPIPVTTGSPIQLRIRRRERLITT